MEILAHKAVREDLLFNIIFYQLIHHRAAITVPLVLEVKVSLIIPMARDS